MHIHVDDVDSYVHTYSLFKGRLSCPKSYISFLALHVAERV